MLTSIQTIRRAVVAIAAIAALAFTTRAEADILVQEFAATFAEIEADGSETFTLADGEVTLSEPDDITGVTIDDLEIDLTGYIAALGNSGPVSVTGGQVTLMNAGTSAVYNVDSASYTQVVNSVMIPGFGTVPIGVGYAELDLSLVSSDLTYGADTVNLEDVYAVISVNGLLVENALATATVVSTGSLSAVPEPSTAALALIGLIGIVGCGRRFRGRKNS